MDQARLAQEYANLGSIYDPQTALIQQQISQLPTQYEAQKSALEQAKINAFRDIGQTAQARGTFFSGFRPQEMARYTGERYLPALANLTAQQQQRQAQLESALQQVGAQRQREATVNLQNILKLEAAQQAAAAQAAAARAPRASGGGGGGRVAAPKAPTISSSLQELFAGYDPTRKEDRNYTENVVIKQLMDQFGISKAQAATAAYKYRKATFGE